MSEELEGGKMSEEPEIGIFEGNLYFNGINGLTGDYGLKPMPSTRLARLIQGKAEDKDRAEFLAHDAQTLTKTELERRAVAEKVRLAELKDKKARQTHLSGFPVKEGVDPTELSQSGWAIVFPAKMEARRKEQIKEAMKPLFDHRRQEAGELFRIFEGGSGYRPGERKDEFFKRQDPEIRPGPADPAQMPFYVLLIGSPEEIPYSFQFQLDVMRAVGRLDFGEDLTAYARYAQSVVLAETGQVKLPRRAAFFGVANPEDKATQLSARWLVQPLYENLQNPAPAKEIKLAYDWQLAAYIGEKEGKKKATKAQLKDLLGGDPAQTPALLFTASHGMEFPASHGQEQLRYQGALLCQDWGGPGTDINRDHYFAGEDLTCDSCVLGMMAMFFACYGAGTPRYDQFAQQAFKSRAPIAPTGFIGALPNRLLSQGMLAVIGHVERAWGYSFVSPGGHLDNQAFITSLRKLMNGEPVGLATDPSFDLRYADMSSQLSTVLEELNYNPDYINEFELAHLWTANNDARNYVIIGDPAARLPVDDVDLETAVQPTITISHVPPQPAQLGDKDATPSDSSVPTPTSPEPVTTGAGPSDVPLDAKAISLAFSSERSGLTESLKEFTTKLATSISRAADDISSLEVTTYTSDSLEGVIYNHEAKKLTGNLHLRALTRIAFDGDVQIVVPEKNSEIDEAVWQIHMAMVKEAQANRTEFLRALAELTVRLIEIL